MFARSALLCACAVAALAHPQPQQGGGGYTRKYDNIDIDKVIGSRRLVSNYVMCLADQKPCSPEGAELKKVLPDAIRTKCAKCSETQKQKAIKVIRKLQKDYPAEWKLVSNKWDPSGQLIREFNQEMAKRNNKQG